MRMKIGKFDQIPYNVLNIGKADYCEKRDMASPYLRTLERIFWPRSIDIKKDESWYILYNIFQVVRKAIHDVEASESKGVDSFPPMNIYGCGLPKIEVKTEEGEEKP
jgi:hypothetical protein